MLKLTALQATPALVIGVIIFIVIIIGYLLGHRTRQYRNKQEPLKESTELGAINGTLLGLLGLLLAFTFGMASNRFDARREVIVNEANNIGTVILRADLYPDTIRQQLRYQLARYVQTRIDFYDAGMNAAKVLKASAATDSISAIIWATATRYASQEPSNAKTTQLMIPALGSMIDITTTRRAAGEANIPDSIMYFLFILCASSAFLLGYDNKQKIDWIVLGGLAIMLSATVFTITDLDRPRTGLISLQKSHQKILELKQMLHMP
jgi:hypothetical protein